MTEKMLAEDSSVHPFSSAKSLRRFEAPRSKPHDLQSLPRFFFCQHRQLLSIFDMGEGTRESKLAYPRHASGQGVLSDFSHGLETKSSIVTLFERLSVGCGKQLPSSHGLGTRTTV